MLILSKRPKLDREHWRVILLSSLGGALEFYDFIIFAIFAVSIGDTFFPASNAINASLHAFSVFAVGYLARPIGGILFSHFGDRYGRKNVFVISMSLMAGSTFLMALVPPYSHWGIVSTLLFIFLRLCQGIAIGGEIPGAITYVKERIEFRSGLACGVIFLFINLGIFLADVSYGVLNLFISSFQPWRVAFFLGGALAIISYFLRRTLEETNAFKQIEDRPRLPMLTLWQTYPGATFQGIGIVACQAGIIAMLYLYLPAYMKIHGYSPTEISWITSISLAVFSIGCGVWGALSDYFGSRKILIMSILLTMPMSFIFYQAILLHYYPLAFYLILAAVSSMYTGAFSAYLANLFPVAVRFSGVAFSYNFSFAIVGGLSPLLASYLVLKLNDPLSPAYLVVVVCLMGLVSLLKNNSLKHKRV